MVKPLSLDLRMRVAAALNEGVSVRAAAKRFDISVASAVRMGQLARAGKGLAARKIGGHRQPILKATSEAVTARLAAKSDWTVRALAADLKTDGISVSHDTVWRFCGVKGAALKKNANGKRNGSTEAGPPADALESLSTSI